MTSGSFNEIWREICDQCINSERAPFEFSPGTFRAIKQSNWEATNYGNDKDHLTIRIHIVYRRRQKSRPRFLGRVWELSASYLTGKFFPRIGRVSLQTHPKYYGQVFIPPFDPRKVPQVRIRILSVIGQERKWVKKTEREKLCFIILVPLSLSLLLDCLTVTHIQEGRTGCRPIRNHHALSWFHAEKFQTPLCRTLVDKEVARDF